MVVEWMVVEVLWVGAAVQKRSPVAGGGATARGDLDLVTDNAAKEAFSSRQQPNIAMRHFFQLVSFQDWQLTTSLGNRWELKLLIFERKKDPQKGQMNVSNLKNLYSLHALNSPGICWPPLCKMSVANIVNGVHDGFVD